MILWVSSLCLFTIPVNRHIALIPFWKPQGGVYASPHEAMIWNSVSLSLPSARRFQKLSRILSIYPFTALTSFKQEGVGVAWGGASSMESSYYQFSPPRSGNQGNIIYLQIWDKKLANKGKSRLLFTTQVTKPSKYLQEPVYCRRIVIKLGF